MERIASISLNMRGEEVFPENFNGCHHEAVSILRDKSARAMHAGLFEAAETYHQMALSLEIAAWLREIAKGSKQ